MILGWIGGWVGGEMDEWVDGYLFYLRGLNPQIQVMVHFSLHPQKYTKNVRCCTHLCISCFWLCMDHRQLSHHAPVCWAHPPCPVKSILCWIDPEL